MKPYEKLAAYLKYAHDLETDEVIIVTRLKDRHVIKYRVLHEHGEDLVGIPHSKIMSLESLLSVYRTAGYHIERRKEPR